MKNPSYTDKLREIREHKREMKARGVRIICFMNAGLSREECTLNCQLFQLKTELSRIPAEIPNP